MLVRTRFVSKWCALEKW